MSAEVRRAASVVHVCPECDHLMSRHLWDYRKGGSLVDGPYLCPCGCARKQSDPTRTITNRQYEAGELFKEVDA